jgi:hypothetical protein
MRFRGNASGAAVSHRCRLAGADVVRSFGTYAWCQWAVHSFGAVTSPVTRTLRVRVVGFLVLAGDRVVEPLRRDLREVVVDLGDTREPARLHGRDRG